MLKWNWTERANATFELSESNQNNNESVHCWCEGGDTGWDDEVLGEMEYWMRKIQDDALDGMKPTDTMMEIIDIYTKLGLDSRNDRAVVNRVFMGSEEDVLAKLQDYHDQCMQLDGNELA